MSTQHQHLVEEQSERFYGLYERKANSFRTALIVVTGLLTVGFVLIFYPYVTFRASRYAQEARLEALTGNLSEAEERAKASRWLLAEYRRLEPQVQTALGDVDLRAIKKAARYHERKLATVRAAAGGDPELEPWLSGRAVDRRLPRAVERRYPELEGARDEPCFWRSGPSWIRCVLDDRVGRAHGEAIGALGYKRNVPGGPLFVNPHLRNSLFLPLAEALEKLRESYGAYLLGEAQYWEVDGEKIERDLCEQGMPFSRAYCDLGEARYWEVDGEKHADNLNEQHTRFSRAYRDLLSRHERFVYDTVQHFEREIFELGKKRENVEQELETTLMRLEGMKDLQNVQTPFGPLPIGINELVLFFPVVLAGGFVLCASLFAETLQLRHEYHRLTRLKDPTGQFMDDTRIALAAPVWIDPLQPVSQRVYRVAILALPVGVFIVAIVLLLDNLLFTSFMEEARLSPLVCVVLYGVSGLAIVEGGRRIWCALRTDAAPLAAARDPTGLGGTGGGVGI